MKEAAVVVVGRMEFETGKKRCIEDFTFTSQRIEKLKIENVVLRRYSNDKCLRSGTDRAVQLKNEERHHHNRK